ncbi:MAG: sigma-70 family RNA polymerase sigma factor [Flavobacteriales bacterium]|nr:sigma-70 family RNA polymerase sigma factor [Flavobacteriales bacterium]MBK6883572.1 sigma-70 family RNA polymerase sigma factor [Flavobacteriales bacterium]MBK7102257.1 sigma-70 family RNA polymerase sigma factor [Flavobacteriales bacterium]MBK7112996.1 sigma-70 family RNA polymerase sigma factor [Flavobacteriales bacterium]MBK7483007.1 sigma-70 family RNA polymerase sigma factor [Flavobacteriales bacterium]
MVDESLIARCIREEPKAQYEMYRALYGMMMSICSRYERNRQDAAALMNQGFLKILQNLGKKRSEVPFEPWARRIVINTVIDGYRKERERKEQETMEQPLEQIPTAEVNDYLRQMEAEAFAELLECVPKMSRNVFNLFAIDGFAHAEIAQLLNISEGTSKWHVSNARGILQQAIARLAVTSNSTTR